VVSIGVVIFLAMVIFVFWLSQISGRKTIPTGYWKKVGQ
jgi:hypothetical protein